MSFSTGDLFSLKLTFTSANLRKILNKDPWHIPKNKALKKNVVVRYATYYGDKVEHPHYFSYTKEYTRYGEKRYAVSYFCLNDEEVNLLLKCLGPQSKQLELDFGGE